MTDKVLQSTTAPTYPHFIDTTAITPRLETLVRDAMTGLMSVDDMMELIRGDLTPFLVGLRSLPAHEGRILEAGIRLLAKSNADLIVLPPDLKLPILDTAVALVESNSALQMRGLSLSVDRRSPKTYTPDLVIVNRATRIAHVIDVKRSLTSYDSARIGELKTRMLASALAVPDLLWRDFKRTVAEDVRIVILDATGKKADAEQGIWSFADLDHLLEIDGAARAMADLRAIFSGQMNRDWATAKARVQLETMTSERTASLGCPLPTVADNDERNGSQDQSDRLLGSAIRVGFARIPGRALN